MEMEDNTIRLSIICPDPTCSTRKEITVLNSTLNSTETGIVTISISKGLVCNHSFQVFVDRNGRVRGYKKPDFELTFTPDEEPSVKPQIQEQDRVLQGGQVILGEEIFLKILRTSICGLPIYAITDVPSIGSMMENFKQLMKPYVKEFTVCSLNEYNQNHRALLSMPGYDEAFVIAIDQHIIINQIYDEKYKEKDFALEKSLLTMIDLNQSNDVTTRELHSLFDQILEVSASLNEEFLKDKFSKKGDVIKRISKLIDKNLALDVDALDCILKNKFDFDMDAYFKERSRASEWGKGILDLTG
ncbi:MAG: hypothetical protein ACFFF9_17470 [Candidatus Thorarchaeota archaeon]